MGKETNISYVDHTWSPWIGCTEVSPGCQQCYARTLANRMGAGWGNVQWGKGKPRYRCKTTNPFLWNKKVGYGVRAWEKLVEYGYEFPKPTSPRIFPSLCDVGDPEVPLDWFNDFMVLVDKTQYLTWLLLTKRPEEFALRWMKVMRHWGRTDYTLPSNVWMGVTCENNATFMERLPLLRAIPAKVRWVSFEPLLEPLHLIPVEPWPDWVIIGGESGPHRRDCGVDAIVNLARRTFGAGIATWVKQDCALRPGQQGRIPDEIWKIKELPQ